MKGGGITLGRLFAIFGERCTAQELMFWYYHAPKLCKKRQHAWGSKDVRDAAKFRKETFGHWGHRR